MESRDVVVAVATTPFLSHSESHDSPVVPVPTTGTCETNQLESSEDGIQALGPLTPPAEIMELEKSPDIVELGISRKGKRKMLDRESDADSGVPVGDEGVKKRITTRMVAEDDSDSDIEFIGSRTNLKNIIVQTTVKMETPDLPIKLESLAADSVVSPNPHWYWIFLIFFLLAFTYG